MAFGSPTSNRWAKNLEYFFGVSRLSSVLDWWLNGDMLIFSNYDNELHHNIFYCSDWTMGLLADCEQAFNTRDLYTALNVDKTADDNACMYVFLLYIFSFISHVCSMSVHCVELICLRYSCRYADMYIDCLQ